MRAANFVQETTVSIAGTAGNGAVTMTAITLVPRASNALGTQATTSRYIMEQKSTGYMESGIGIFSANVLTRTRPQVTWNGTTYADASGGTVAPLAFGSTPTAGDVLIRIGAVAESSPISQPGRQTLIAGDGAWDAFPYSTHLIGANSGSGRNFSANTEYYSCYYNQTPGLVSGAALNVSTIGANIKWAIYDVGSSGLPNNKILTLNNMAVGTTGFKTDTAVGTWSPAGGLWLPAGWVVIGFIADAAVSLLGFGNGAYPTLYNRRGGYGFSDTLYKAGSYATGMPSVPNLGGGTMADPGSSSNGFAWLGLKVIA